MNQRESAIALLDSYIPVDSKQSWLREVYLDHLASHPNGARRECLPDHLTASALVVDPQTQQVLLGLHVRAGLWLQMGGHIEETDDSLASAALREAEEETGIAGLSLYSELPLRLDRHGAPCGPRAEHHLDVQFLVIAPAHSTPILSPEQLSLRWCPRANLPEPTDDAVRALVEAAFEELAR